MPNSGEFILTWARFHAPSGYALHRRGVLPDICTTGEVVTPADVVALLQSGALPIAGDLRRPEVAPEDQAPGEEPRASCPHRTGHAETDHKEIGRAAVGD